MLHAKKEKWQAVLAKTFCVSLHTQCFPYTTVFTHTMQLFTVVLPSNDKNALILYQLSVWGDFKFLHIDFSLPKFLNRWKPFGVCKIRNQSEYSFKRLWILKMHFIIVPSCHFAPLALKALITQLSPGFQCNGKALKWQWNFPKETCGQKVSGTTSDRNES